MRTTLAIEDMLLALVKPLAQSTGRPSKKVLEEALGVRIRRVPQQSPWIAPAAEHGRAVRSAANDLTRFAGIRPINPLASWADA